MQKGYLCPRMWYLLYFGVWDEKKEWNEREKSVKLETKKKKHERDRDETQY